MAAIVSTNQSNSANYIQGTIKPVITITAATTLTTAQSGCIVLVSKAAAYTITLPPPTLAGLSFTLLGGAVAAFAATVACGAGLLSGHWRQISGAATAATAATSIAFTATSVLGDRAEFLYDGTQWQVVASGAAAASFVFA